MKPRFFKTYADFEDWLAQNHDQYQEFWVGYYKKSSQKASITWEESVEAALCYGWIDGLRKSVDQESYTIRFTPRRPQSVWSAKNIQTAQKLIKQGRMHEAGKRAFAKRKENKSRVYSFEKEKTAFREDFEATFKGNVQAWSFFQSQAPYYQRAAQHWVMSARQEKTQVKRLHQLIADSENGRKVKPLRRKGE